MKNSISISYSIYSDADFVDRYAGNILDNPWNACYERPSTLSLLPDIHDKKLLDAGCGPGVTTEILVNKGATVTAVDYSPPMIEKARKRVGGKAEISLVDLNDGLGLFPDDEFDIIFSSLTIHYIDDLNMLFSEFSRVLKQDGLLVFSTDHPENPDFLENPVTEKRLNNVPWSNYGINMQVYERPWEDIITALKDHNFEIEKVMDATPTEECSIKYPKEYEYLRSNPHFICVRAKNTKTIKEN
jgi:ubiquinone/menaquinone biosynthesis C-methylase UbiE